MPVPSLPTELLDQVLSLAIRKHDRPVDLLLVNSTFHAIGLRELHQYLSFCTVKRLERFSKQPPKLLYPPRAIDIQLAGGIHEPDLILLIRDIFSRCRSQGPRHGRKLLQGETDEGTVSTSIRHLNLCFNSHNGDPNISKLRDVFSVVNPQTFCWTGPDPGHHFSNAIIPTAALYLLQAASHWTNLQELTLTHISFLAFSPLRGPMGKGITAPEPPFTALPLLDLHTITLGQVIFLAPWLVVRILESQPTLKRLKLVDAYRESIWGRRIRQVDIEATVADEFEDDNGWLLARAKEVVSCESQTERIVGGDRMDGEK